MMGMAAFAVCLFVAFLALCIVFMVAPDQYLKSERVLVCPETRQATSVKVNVLHRLLSFLCGREILGLRACARWPGRRDCGQACLLQVDADPRILGRVLRSWYEGKRCALCSRALAEADWRLGHYSALDEAGIFHAAGEISIAELPMLVSQYRPVCWECHLNEVSKRAPHTFAGDRRGKAEEVWTGE